MTRPTEPERLAAFYRLVRPSGPGWKPVRRATRLTPAGDSLPQALLGWVLGVAFVYAALFGTGSFLYGRTALAVMWLIVFLGSGLGLLRVVPRMWLTGGGDSGGSPLMARFGPRDPPPR
jgi:hypothetical protein